MKKWIFLFAVLLCASTFSRAQKQGISGKVFWLSGNQMPSPSLGATPQQGAAREIFIYKIATVNDATQNGNFFGDVKTELVGKTFSDYEGSFKIKLPPGEYSVLVKEPQGLFANSLDKDNKINAVVVKPGKFSWVTINIDYEAAY
jgi:hypothetical protein